MRVAHLPLLIALTASSPVAVAAEVRPSTAAEFAQLVLGCWEMTSGHPSLPPAASDVLELTACFRENGRVETNLIGGNPEVAIEGFDDYGEYVITDDKVILTGGQGRTTVVCDGLVRPDVELRLLDCVGSGPYPNEQPRAVAALADMHFTAKVD